MRVLLTPARPMPDRRPTAAPRRGGPGGGGPPDAAPPDAGRAPGGGTALPVQPAYTATDFDLLAVDPAGTAFGVQLSGSAARIWASADGRAWSARGAASGDFWNMTALSDGALIADLSKSGGHALARSSDHGNTWTDVLTLGTYRSLSPHSFAELDGAVYFVEYQVFTTSSTAIRLWRSTDRGATWSVRFTFQGHRHGHGLRADPDRHALFAFFGDFDSQSGLYRSTDGGASWTLIKGGTQAGDIVDGVVLGDGSFLCGQDISYH